jgi:aspartate kinase
MSRILDFTTMSQPKDDAMTSVVMKFGGTSVKDPARMRAVARHIAQRARHGARIVAVVSAMGATTDALLDLAGELSDQPPPRELDLLMATGESAAASLLCIALEAVGVPARSFTGADAGIATSGDFGRGRITGIDPDPLTRALDAGVVPVVAGFQGSRGDGEVTTLGRGGSDTTAVAIAASLGVACEIYTDVDGVFASDPRVVPDADPRPLLTRQALGHMSANGSTVVARRAVELASTHRVRLQVRSSFSWQPGTVVQEDFPPLETHSVLAVSHDRSAVLVTLRGIAGDPSTLAAVLLALDDAQVPLTLVPRAVGARPGADDGVIGLVINRDDLSRAVAALEPVVRRWGGRVVVGDGLALVTVVGVGLITYAGVAAAIAGTVGDITPAAELLVASPSVITWLVPAVLAPDVVRGLCDVLGLRSAQQAEATG